MKVSWGVSNAPSKTEGAVMPSRPIRPSSSFPVGRLPYLRGDAVQQEMDVGYCGVLLH